jgi:hypothetical protein
LRIEVAGAYWLPQTVTLSAPPPNAPRGGTLHLSTVGLAGCYALLATRVEIGPCAGLEMGLYEGSAFGVSEPGTGATTWTALRLGTLASWRIVGPLALRMLLEGVLPVDRPTFQITGVGNVHRPAPLSGRAAAGIEMRF